MGDRFLKLQEEPCNPEAGELKQAFVTYIKFSSLHGEGWHRLRSELMDKLGLKSYCCRRMVITQVDLIENLLKYVDHISWELSGVLEVQQKLARIMDMTNLAETDSSQI